MPQRQDPEQQPAPFVLPSTPPMDRMEEERRSRLVLLSGQQQTETDLLIELDRLSAYRLTLEKRLADCRHLMALLKE